MTYIIWKQQTNFIESVKEKQFVKFLTSLFTREVPDYKFQSQAFLR